MNLKKIVAGVALTLTLSSPALAINYDLDNGASFTRDANGTLHEWHMMEDNHWHEIVKLRADGSAWIIAGGVNLSDCNGVIDSTTLSCPWHAVVHEADGWHAYVYQNGQFLPSPILHSDGSFAGVQ